jgi:hypothetical protein
VQEIAHKKERRQAHATELFEAAHRQGLAHGE